MRWIQAALVAWLVVSGLVWMRTPDLERPPSHDRRQPRPSLSGDGRLLAWEWKGEVVVWDRRNDRRRVLRSPLGPCRSPVISSDGRYLAYTKLGPQAVSDLWLMDLETEEERVWVPPTRITGKGSCFAPRLSSDGSHLTCLTYLPVPKSAQFAPTPGLLMPGRQLQIPFPQARCHGPVSLSPDGRRMAWEHRDFQDRLMVAEEGGSPALLWLGGAEPVLSDRHCAFVAPDHRGRYQLRLHDFEQAKTRTLTRGQEDCLEPSISSDGSRIAYTLYGPGQQVVHLSDGTGPGRSIGSGYHPGLSADGSTLAYVTPGKLHLWERGQESYSLDL